MKITRHQNLTKILDETFLGVIARFAKAIGKSPTQARAILFPEKNGGRTIGEKLARDIEESLGLEKGWLDQDHSADVPNPENNTISQLAQAVGPLFDKAEPDVQQAIMSLLIRYQSDKAEGARIAKAIKALLGAKD